MELHLRPLTMSSHELHATAAFLLSLSPAAQRAAVQPTVTHNGGSSEPGAAPSSGDLAGASNADVRAEPSSTAAAAVVEEAAVAPVKRGRPRKDAEPKTEPEAPTPVAEPQQAADTAPAEQAAPTDLSTDALRAALQRFTADKGVPAGVDLLGEFDCKRVSELAEKSDAAKAKFIARCPAAAKEAA